MPHFRSRSVLHPCCWFPEPQVRSMKAGGLGVSEGKERPERLREAYSQQRWVQRVQVLSTRRNSCLSELHSLILQTSTSEVVCRLHFGLLAIDRGRPRAKFADRSIISALLTSLPLKEHETRLLREGYLDAWSRSLKQDKLCVSQ